jgi:hypothetical protein
MDRFFRLILSTALGSASFLAYGCGSDPELVPAKGKVTYHGTPLNTGTVVLTPDLARGGSGPLAKAEIQPDGTFVLATGELKGVAPGWYHVTILAMEMSQPANADQPALPHSLIPEKYGDPQLSDLSCQVRLDKENLLEFHLE